LKIIGKSSQNYRADTTQTDWNWSLLQNISIEIAVLMIFHMEWRIMKQKAEFGFRCRCVNWKLSC